MPAWIDRSSSYALPLQTCGVADLAVLAAALLPQHSLVSLQWHMDMVTCPAVGHGSHNGIGSVYVHVCAALDMLSKMQQQHGVTASQDKVHVVVQYCCCELAVSQQQVDGQVMHVVMSMSVKLPEVS